MLHISHTRYKGLEVMEMEMYGCCGTRGFYTKDEKIGMLKEYKESLEKEAKGVGERIKELEKSK